MATIPTDPQSANEYAANKLGSWDFRGKDPTPYYDEWNAQQSTAANTATEPSIKWSSDTGGLSYNPGGGADWSQLTESMLSDPATLSMFNTGLNTGGAAQGAYQAFNTGLSPETQAAITGISGSTHSLAPEVLGKMWSPPRP